MLIDFPKKVISLVSKSDLRCWRARTYTHRKKNEPTVGPEMNPAEEITSNFRRYAK